MTRIEFSVTLAEFFVTLVDSYVTLVDSRRVLCHSRLSDPSGCLDGLFIDHDFFSFFTNNWIGIMPWIILFTLASLAFPLSLV